MTQTVARTQHSGSFWGRAACVGLLEDETGGGLLTIYDTVEPAFGT